MHIIDTKEPKGAGECQWFLKVTVPPPLAKPMSVDMKIFNKYYDRLHKAVIHAKHLTKR